ncbi:MAG: DUF58 domain-containing protein [Flavobacteriaceae bacterium]|nr:DUF58 domain-containing protein [Flavobacteriaceae bacterium]
MDTKELLKKVRKIEIKTRRLSSDIFGGEYHSTFKGRGMTFSEVRSYQYGDDVRVIDWNVTARYNTPFVKIFEEERELTVLLVVDVSGSEFFGTANQLKREVVTEIAATLAFSALQNNDKVGLVLFAQTIEKYIPPKRGRSHLLRIIRELLEFEPQTSKTSIGTALEFISSVLKKKAIAFLLSDFIDNDYQRQLSIAAKKHDLTGIRVYDSKEEEIPNIGLTLTRDAETGKLDWINTSSKSVRNQYQDYFKKLERQFELEFQRNNAGVVNCRTDESFVKKLLNYFKTRG